jgi:hypothetical protein
MRGKTKKKISYLPVFTAFISPIIVFVIHLLSINFGFYTLIPNLDVPMHFAGGMAIAAMAIQLLNFFEKQKQITFKSHILHAFLLLAIVGFVASLWEISEFSADIFLGWSLQYSLFDTMKDMILGLTGGAIVIISWIYGKTHN